MPAKPLTAERARIKNERKRLRAWKNNSVWFARGGDARVYLKAHTGYPSGFYKERGGIVKIYKNPGYARYCYWSMKIAHELFPKVTVRPRALRFNERVKLAEIHVEEVEVHQELKQYQHDLSKRKPEVNTDFIRLRKHPHYGRLETMQDIYGTVAQIYHEELARAGIYSGMTENATNVSLADPGKPIFFEPQVGDTKLTLRYIHNPENNVPPQKAKRVELFIKRLKSIPEFDYEP